jgi:thiamine pyrophosphate-dependent acetolactate synthase large subunit-like protein
VVIDIFYLISLLSLICITCRQMLRATNNMDVDEADVQHISSPIAYHADLVDPAYESEATLVYAFSIGMHLLHMCSNWF